MYGFGDACFVGITAHFEGIALIPIRFPTPRCQLEVGLYTPRIFDAYMAVQSYAGYYSPLGRLSCNPQQSVSGVPGIDAKYRQSPQGRILSVR